MNKGGTGRIFETDRLIVRLFNEKDGDNFFALNGDPEVMRYIRAPKTREECDLFLIEVIAWSVSRPGMGRWAVDEKSTGLFVGSFAIIPIPGDEEKIQLGYSLLPAYWGNGFATELTNGGLHYFMTQTTLPEIYGVTETENIASENVLKKTGFLLSGSKIEGEKELRIYIVRREEG